MSSEPVELQRIEQEGEPFSVHDAKSANWLIRKIVECRRYREHVEQWAAAEIKRAEREEAFFFTRYGHQLEAWARRQIGTQRGRKSVKLPAGTLGFRRETARGYGLVTGLSLVSAAVTAPDKPSAIMTLAIPAFFVSEKRNIEPP